MSEDVVIKIKRLSGYDPSLPLPSRGTAGSAGFDVRAANDEPIIIPPGGRSFVPTGFAIELPPGYEAQIRPRSGLAIKHGVTLLNSPGTIDEDYRGEVKLIMINHGSESFVVRKDDRVAQMIIGRLAPARLEEVEELGQTARNEGGFGHTGR